MEFISSYKKRFKMIRKALNFSQIEFADRLKYSSHVSIANIESGKAQLSSEKLMLLKELYPQIDVNWLLTGKGEMFTELTEPETRESLLAKLDWIDDFGRKILSGEIELTPELEMKIDIIYDMQQVLIKRLLPDQNKKNQK